MTRTALFAGFAASALAGNTLADVNLTSVDRYVLVASEGGFETDGPLMVSGPASGPWTGDEFSSAVQGANGGDAAGYQVSDIQPGAYSGFVDGAASAFGDGSDFASGYGESHFEIEFSVTTPSDWTLEGFVNAFGSVNGEISRAMIELTNLGDSSVLYSEMVEDDFIAFDVGGTLAPGSYRLETNALAIVDRIFESGFGNSTATVDFELVIVPAPASMAILTLGGLSCARRRRH